MNDISVALISLFVSSFISIVFNFWGYNQTFRKNYSTIISKERMEWIKETRKVATNFLAFCDSHNSIDKNNALEYNKLKNEILINLNLDDPKYENDAIISSLLLNSSYKEIKENLPVLRRSFSENFKHEWDKAKLEAGRSRVHVWWLDKKSEELEEYYNSKEC